MVNETELKKLAQACIKAERELANIRIAKNKTSRFQKEKATTGSAFVPNSTGNAKDTGGKLFSAEQKKEFTAEQTLLKQEGKCFICKKPGHISPYCPEKDRKEITVGSVKELANSGKD